MIKLLIADDEKIIRETIANLIDWESLGVRLIGAARDGIEAYHIILDEYPDIVLTDIKMPGLSGLDLIEKIYQINQDTQFIILSGYGEFEYAKKAMQFGVRHYLLKPCNEEQIINSVKELMADRADRMASDRGEDRRIPAIGPFNSGLLINIINNGLACSGSDSDSADKECADEAGTEDVYRLYGKYLDFSHTPYEVCYLYFVEDQDMQDGAEAVWACHRSYFPGIVCYLLYVHNTLLFFFPSFRKDYQILDSAFSGLILPRSGAKPSYRRESHASLALALDEIIRHIRRYETIYFIDGDSVFTICNYKNIIKRVQTLASRIYVPDSDASQAACGDLLASLASVRDVNFLKQLASSIVIISASKLLSFSAVSAAEFLVRINGTEDCQGILSALQEQLGQLCGACRRAASGELSQRIRTYVEAHLCEPQLSLKWIADQYLYMNVDYVSKKFLKETGQKFSKYLTDVRIRRAKELLADADTDKIQHIAQLIGCGNNPQYFSQIFKKSTGMTPSSYIRMIRGEKT